MIYPEEPSTTPAIQKRVEELAAWIEETEKIIDNAWKATSKIDKKSYGTSSVKKLSCEQTEIMVSNAGMTLPPRPTLSESAKNDLLVRESKFGRKSLEEEFVSSDFDDEDFD